MPQQLRCGDGPRPFQNAQPMTLGISKKLPSGGFTWGLKECQVAQVVLACMICLDLMLRTVSLTYYPVFFYQLYYIITIVIIPNRHFGIVHYISADLLPPRWPSNVISASG